MIEVETRLGTTITVASFTMRAFDDGGKRSLTPFDSFRGKTFMIMGGEVDPAGKVIEVRFVEVK